MGAGFAILLQLVIVGIIAVVLAVIIGTAVKLWTRRSEHTWRKAFVASIMPFVFLYSFYFLLLFSAIIISSVKDVDVGVGDAWYVPVTEDHRILMIDIVDSGYLEFKDETLLSSIEFVHTDTNNLIFETSAGKLHSLNTYNGNLDELKPGNYGFATSHSIRDYYLERKRELTRGLNWVLGVTSVVLSLLITWLSAKMITTIWKLFGKKEATNTK